MFRNASAKKRNICIFYKILVHFSVISSYGKSFLSFVHVNISCVGAGISTLMSISDVLDPYVFCRKMEKTRSRREEMEGKMFISRQSCHFSFVKNMIKVLLPNCTSNWSVNFYVSSRKEI